MSDKMEVLKLLLMFLTVSGYSYVLQPRLTVTQIAALDRDHQSEMRSEPLRNVSLSAEEKEKSVESTERRKTQEEQRSEGLTPETKPEKTRMKEKIEVEMIGFFDSSQEYEEGGEERLIPEMTFSTILGEDTDKVDEVERRVDGPNLKPNEESQTDNSKTRETKKAVHSQNTGVQKKGKDDKIKLRQDKEEEERESKLVAGINHHEDTRGVAHEDIEKMVTVNQGNVEEKRGNEERGKRAEKGQSITNANHNELVEREKENDVVFGNLTPPLSTSSTPLGKDFEIPATLQIITQSPNPTTSPPVQHHNVPPSLLVTPTQVSPVSSLPRPLYAKVSPQFFPPSVTLSNPTTISHISVSTVLPGEVRSVSLLTEVLQSPRRHLKQSELEAKAGPNLEDVMVKNLLFKPARTVIQTTMDINTAVQPQETEFIPEVNAATPKQPNPKPKSNENNPTAQPVEFTHKPNMTQPTGEPKAFKLVENDTKLTVRQNKASLPQPQLAKPSAKPQLTTAKTPSLRPTKINRSSKNKSKEKKRKKDNKTQKPSEKKKEVITPAHFPYFMDNYCPPECACYGRVVQCSDKGVDNVPYGIPYNARYILLMNNHINSIQLDLLNEYVSMEFLVLSNNRLTDGAIEGAFEGVPALKRLYLDKNLLETVPTDLPVSLEELRLDSNRLIVMSEAAWAQCPGLLVLSLSNNTLGNGSESLPNAVFSPLCNLRTLNLDYNQLTLVPLGLPLSIKELYLKGNLIVQFRTGAFNGISDLVVLDMSANRLTNKGLVRESLLNATHLESLNLEGNRLKQVPRHLPRSLKTLNLEGNLISSIKKADLSTLKNLEHLGLARNKIFKVAPGAFRTLPVLHQLDLCHNTLHQVPRQLPQALHSVALTHNKIQSVPRDAFCWGNKSLTLSRLVRVQLEHNLIDMGKLDAQAFRCLRGFQVVHFY